MQLMTIFIFLALSLGIAAIDTESTPLNTPTYVLRPCERRLGRRQIGHGGQLCGGGGGGGGGGGRAGTGNRGGKGGKSKGRKVNTFSEIG
jgi:hypothetical protein